VFTHDEKRAILFLALIAAAGGVVRVVRAARGGAQPPGSALIAPELKGHDLQRQAMLARLEAELLRPLAPGESIDVDKASARDIERLPRVGPSLAARIVEDRTAHGAFGSIEALDGVAGIGPAMLAAIRPHVKFSGFRRPAPQVANPEGVVRGRRKR
jgi:hypothetical protein